MDRFTKCRT